MRKFKLFFLTLVALLSWASPTLAADVTVYIDPVGDGTWMADDAKISLNIYTDGQSNNQWATLTTHEGNVLKATFDDSYNRMIIVRGSAADDWGWNQSENITPEDNTLYKANGYTGDSKLAYTTVNPYITAPAAGYVVDFNTSIAVPSNNHSDPMFQVSTGWTRIADRKEGDGYYGTAGYYMRYTYSSTAGVDGTGTLLANAQQAPQNNYDGTIETVHDYIVTPKVSGTVTLQVKGSISASNSLPSFINFYAVNDDATTVGSEITATYSADLNTDNFVTVTLTLTEATRIAIRAQWVYMDNFTATSAEIPEVKALTVTSVMNSDGQSGYTGTNPSFEQQSDGTLLVKLKVAIQNTGNVDLVANSIENYTLTLASASSESAAKTYYEDANITLTEDLSVGESTTIEVEKAVNYTDTYGSHRYWFVRENVSGTTSSSYRYATSIAYEPKLIFRVAESTSSSSLSGTQSFGLVSEETTNHYEIANTGTAPLIIKSITLPEGFTSANLPEIPAEGLSIAKGTTQALDITLPITTTGSFAGNLTIVYLDKNSAEQTYTLAFSGNVLAAGTWAADFSVASSSETNYPAGSVAEGGIRFGTTYVSADNYDGYLYSYTSSSYTTENNKFITPKLHANAADKLTFDVSRDGYSSSSYNLKVYVSTDRKTWGDPVYSVTAADLTSSFQTKEISFDAEGDYYVAFAIYGVRVDNIIGLTKVDVAHDLYIKEVTWPDASVKSGTALSRPSLEVIPLTDETAENYTVKYICGETVLAEGTPVALTASANSSKTFSFSWTPSVENTTVYPATKVVFDFGGGVTFETETFDLTVTNEPKFHFVKTLPSSKYYEPSDVSTPIAFGKTNAADKQSFYVYNWGSAPLTVKSIAVPAGFTATPAEQFIVAAFDENDMSVAAQAVDITFSTTEAGVYSGDMVITYLNGANEEQTFSLAVSGTKFDPTKFYANFDDGGWPAGSVYESNVSSSNIGSYSAPNYAITCTSSDPSIFVTPKLTATAGEKLMFDAKLYSSSWKNGKVVVYAAATRDEVLNAEDGTTRVELFSVSGMDAENAMTTDFQTFEVTVPEAGDYFFGFAISGRPYVDEIYGLQVAPVAHDWKIASSNIPAEGMQNVASTATVNILNLGLAEEAADSYTVTAYVDGVAAGTGETVALPMVHQLSATGTQLSVNYRSPKAGTFPVYLEVKTGDYSVATQPVDVVFAEEEAKSEADMATNGTAGDSPLNLNFKNSESVTLYNAAALAAAGISAGSKIKKITYKGYKTTDVQTTSFQVYYKWTNDQTLSQPDNDVYPFATTDMIKHIDEDHTWNKIGSSTELGDMIVLDFSESPLTYESGKSLVIYMHSYVDGYKTAYFEKSTLSSDYCYERQKDDATISGNYNKWTKKTPAALHFTLEATSATLAGSVKTSAGAGIEGATVTIKAENGVQYSGTTDAEGAYNFNVIQAGLDFTATVEKEGYLKRQFALNMGGASKVQDVTMYTQMGIVGDPGMGLSWDDDLVMTQSTEDANIFTVVKENVEIAAGTYKYKLRADGAWNLENKYELPNEGDFSKVFTNAGTYTLTFTANTADHTLALNAVAQINKVQIIGSNELPWNGENTFTVDLIKNSEGIYEGTIDLSSVESSTPFKLVINDNTWIGANMLNLVDTENLVSAEGGDGSNFILANATCGYKTYTVTAAWVANDNEASNWTLTIAGSGEKRNVVYAVVGGVKGSTDEAGIFSAYWDAANTTDIMIENGEGKYEWTITDQNLQAQTFEMKVIKKFENFTTALEWIPANNVELEISEFAKYNITVTFDPSTSEVTAIATMAGPATGIAGLNTNTVDGDIYTVGGVRSEKLVKGQMNIIRTSDGKVRKVYVK